MKILTLGDIHGRNCWKLLPKSLIDECDKIIFLGDYVDSKAPNISRKDEINNLHDIINFKEKYPDKVILLTGNHDIQYIIDEVFLSQPSDSTIQLEKALSTKLKWMYNTGLLTMAHQYDDHLFIHAGITRSWAKGNDIDIYNSKKNVATQLNELFRSRPSRFDYNERDRSGYGNHPNQSPVWVRPEIIKEYGCQNLYQIIGHTRIPEIRKFNYYNVSAHDKLQKSFIMTDVLSERQEAEILLLDFKTGRSQDVTVSTLNISKDEKQTKKDIS